MRKRKSKFIIWFVLFYDNWTREHISFIIVNNISVCIFILLKSSLTQSISSDREFSQSWNALPSYAKPSTIGPNSTAFPQSELLFQKSWQYNARCSTASPLLMCYYNLFSRLLAAPRVFGHFGVTYIFGGFPEVFSHFCPLVTLN